MKDLNRWNPEAYSLIATSILLFGFAMYSGSFRWLPGVIGGMVGMILCFVWMLWYFHRSTEQYRALIRRQRACQHNGSHITSMNGLQDLKNLFNGVITTEQYAKIHRPLVETKCLDCGKVWTK